MPTIFTKAGSGSLTRRVACKKRPPFATGAESRESRHLETAQNVTLIRFPEDVLQFTQRPTKSFLGSPNAKSGRHELQGQRIGNGKVHRHANRHELVAGKHVQHHFHDLTFRFRR
jgi:hypothetical protein